MKPAIDSYCYHRFFGEHYEGLQPPVSERRTIFDVIARAAALGVAGVSVETCFLDRPDAGLAREIGAAARAKSLAVLWAWGHLDGLASGRDTAALDDLVRHVGLAREAGADTMRIVAGSRRTRPADWAAHRAALVPLLSRAAATAADAGVTLALENHLDLSGAEIAELVESVGSPALGICFDTANNLRLLEDPVAVAHRVAPHVRAVHLKDVTSLRGDPRAFGFWPSVPVGLGSVDIPAILAVLAAAGYDGLLAIEVDFLHPAFAGEDAAVAESVIALQRMLATLPVAA